METKINNGGEQQPIDEKGQYTFKHFESPQKKLTELKSQLTSAKGIFERAKIREQIESIEQGFSSVEEYKKHKEEKRKETLKKAEQEKIEKQRKKELEEKEKTRKLEEDIKSSTPHKNKQFEIIKKHNPMLDEYHVGIRSPKDIKSFDEVINDEESFAWGDFSKKDALEALKSGVVTVYSSYDIKQGTFVSTSLNQALEYAGGNKNKVKKSKVKLTDIAWINGDEGQYANVGS